VADAATVTLGPAAGLPKSPAAAQPLVIVGTVYDERCVPVSGASLRVWQTDSDGVYGPGHGTDKLRCCFFQGAVTTGSDGRFQLVTTMPGHYQGEAEPPPAHIHVEIARPGGGGAMTEIVFAGDPHLTDPAAEGYVVVTLAGDAAQSRRGVATIILER
jgi:protocatechuate 3,4-dioxygenase beta subunit